ncbi:hypothetical protein ScPMuIL_017381 [Solemya velum]
MSWTSPGFEAKHGADMSRHHVNREKSTRSFQLHDDKARHDVKRETSTRSLQQQEDKVRYDAKREKSSRSFQQHVDRVRHAPLVTDSEEGYPEPQAQQTCKVQVFSAKDWRDVDYRAENAPEDVSNSYEDLLDYLLEDLDSDIARLRSIFRWLVTRRIPIVLSQEDLPPDSPTEYLHSIQERKGCYAQLFALLCRRAGLQCVIINGCAKSIAYEVGDEVDVSKLRNRWNAVYVEDGWRLVHPYWASQSVKGYETGRWAVVESDDFHQDDFSLKENSLSSEVNEFFFLTDPEKFIIKCFPDSEKWQLLKKPLTKKEYEELAFLQPAFYEHRLQIKKKVSCIVHTTDGKAEVRIGMPEDRMKHLRFKYKLYKLRGTEDEGEYMPQLLDRFLLHHRIETSAIFEMRFPIVGEYKLELHCMDSEKLMPSNWICDFRIVCPEEMLECIPLPIVPAIGWGPGKELEDCGLAALTHDSGVVSIDEHYTTKMKFRLDKEVDLKAELLHYKISKSDLEGCVQHHCEDGEATVEITPPGEGEYALQLFAKDVDGERYGNVCNYVLHRTIFVEDPELAYIRQRLIDCTESGSIGELSQHIDDFVTSGLEDRGDLTKAKKKHALHRINKEIQEAIQSKDLDMLDRMMHELGQNGDFSLKKDLGGVVEHAEELRARLRRIKRLQHAVLEMDQKTISELRSYSKPPPAVHAVMVTTFLLLGNKEIDLKRWPRVQALINKKGKEALKRRVANFDHDGVLPATRNRIKAILTKYDLESVQMASVGAATFYQWVMSNVGENDPSWKREEPVKEEMMKGPAKEETKKSVP